MRRQGSITRTFDGRFNGLCGGGPRGRIEVIPGHGNSRHLYEGLRVIR